MRRQLMVSKLQRRGPIVLRHIARAVTFYSTQGSVTFIEADSTVLGKYPALRLRDSAARPLIVEIERLEQRAPGLGGDAHVDCGAHVTLEASAKSLRNAIGGLVRRAVVAHKSIEINPSCEGSGEETRLQVAATVKRAFVHANLHSRCRGITPFPPR